MHHSSILYIFGLRRWGIWVSGCSELYVILDCCENIAPWFPPSCFAVLNCQRYFFVSECQLASKFEEHYITKEKTIFQADNQCICSICHSLVPILPIFLYRFVIFNWNSDLVAAGNYYLFFVTFAGLFSYISGRRALHSDSYCINVCSVVCLFAGVCW